MSINYDVLRWSLEELASVEVQQRLWLGDSLGEASSFQEAICGVFDDSGLGRAMESGWIAERFGNDITSKVAELGTLVDKVPPNLPPREIIGLPLMADVRRVSRELMNFFAQRIKNPHDPP
jgi:hypothetical protein